MGSGKSKVSEDAKYMDMEVVPGLDMTVIDKTDTNKVGWLEGLFLKQKSISDLADLMIKSMRVGDCHESGCEKLYAWGAKPRNNELMGPCQAVKAVCLTVKEWVKDEMIMRAAICCLARMATVAHNSEIIREHEVLPIVLAHAKKFQDDPNMVENAEKLRDAMKVAGVEWARKEIERGGLENDAGLVMVQLRNHADKPDVVIMAVDQLYGLAMLDETIDQILASNAMKGVLDAMILCRDDPVAVIKLANVLFYITRDERVASIMGKEGIVREVALCINTYMDRKDGDVLQQLLYALTQLLQSPSNRARFLKDDGHMLIDDVQANIKQSSYERKVVVPIRLLHMVRDRRKYLERVEEAEAEAAAAEAERERESRESQRNRVFRLLTRNPTRAADYGGVSAADEHGDVIADDVVEGGGEDYWFEVGEKFAT
jgi:hypothetical protein